MYSYIKTPLVYAALICLVVLSSCKSNGSLMKCPDLVSSKMARPHEKVFARNYHRPDHNKTLKSEAAAKSPAVDPKDVPTLTASADKQVPFQIKLPSFAMKKVKSDEELSQMNSALNSFSADKVSLVRKDNGKIYLTAGSAKDFVVMTQNIAKAMAPRGYYEKRYGGNGGGGGDRAGAAIAAGILGPIAFVFAFLPLLDFAALPIGLAAIITGAIGIRSHRRGLAIMGLVFGILSLFIALLTIALWHAIFFVFLL